MADTAHSTEAHAGVPGQGEAHQQPSLLNPSPTMMGLTWLTFGLMALVLYKVAWKPILAGLAKRESDIRKTLEEAQKTRDEYALIEQKRQQAIAEADAKAKEIVDAARQAAVDAAAVIEAKAREESQILLANAQREIKTAQEKAVDSLRRESADLAIGLSRKIIGANLDDARSRELVDRILRTM
jgi:F-type H+-transporting ATPase subunit b